MAKSKTKSANTDYPVYVIAGPDKTLNIAEANDITDKLLGNTDRSMALLKTRAKDTSASEIFDELRTLPFLTKKKVVILSDADKFISENREILEKYFDNPAPTGSLIIIVEKWDARTKLAKKLPKVGLLLEIKQPKTWQLPKMLTAYATDKHNMTLNNHTAQFLVDLAGDNLTSLYTEVDKLALYCLDKKTITTNDVTSLAGSNRFFNAFEVIDASLTGDIDNAIKRLREMFAADRSAQYTVIGAFAFQIRQMFNAKKMLLAGQNQITIERTLRIWKDKDRFFANINRIKLNRIGDFLCRIAEIDHAVKTGRERITVAMENFLLLLTKAAAAA